MCARGKQPVLFISIAFIFHSSFFWAAVPLKESSCDDDDADHRYNSLIAIHTAAATKIPS